jgi:glutamyl-tRNA reductase
MAAVDLPESVASQLLTESVGNIQANNRDGRNAGTIATNVLAGAMARNFDELGTVESRANSGIIATPVASPAVQTGS